MSLRRNSPTNFAVLLLGVPLSLAAEREADEEKVVTMVTQPFAHMPTRCLCRKHTVIKEIRVTMVILVLASR